jgi:hypothetical protein
MVFPQCRRHSGVAAVIARQLIDFAVARRYTVKVFLNYAAPSPKPIIGSF